MSLASEMIQTQMEMEIINLISGGVIEPRVTVVGCGGAANEILARAGGDLRGATKILINTDMHGLQRVEADRKICIGKGIVHNGDSGGFVEVAEKCGELASDEIRASLTSSDVVFVIAGLGGGTGTALVSQVANIAKGMGILAFAICIMPFSAEGCRRQLAEERLPVIREAAFSTVVFDNDSLLRFSNDVTLSSAFRVMDRNVMKLIKDTTENMGRSFIATLAGEIMACQSEMALVDSGPVVFRNDDMGAHAGSEGGPDALPSLPDLDLSRTGGMFERY